MPVQVYSIGPLGTNCYLFHNDVDAVVVDPGGDMEQGLADVMLYLNTHKLRLAAILCSHLHFDHIYGVAHLHEVTGAPVFAHEADIPMLDNEMGGGGKWGFASVAPFTPQPLAEGRHRFGSLECDVLHTPGHTPGSLSFSFPEEKALFGGDLLFYRSVGRSDFPGGDAQALIHSIRTQIYTLPDDTTVYPGHGQATTVAAEKAGNPFTR